MYQVARETEDNLRTLFRNTAQKTGLHEAITEKDFWVCFILDYLFHKNKWGKSIVFKGGTSLSKCYGVINRFSEDIDLILDWRILGYQMKEPWEDRTKSKQDQFNKEVNHRAELFLRDCYLPDLKTELAEILGIPVDIYIDDTDPQTICFQYPNIFRSEAILQIIRLEIGPLAVWTPAIRKTVKPYAAAYYPQLFAVPETIVLSVAAERTFWEKVTILHHEANRPESSPMPARYSRHYYDLFCMTRSNIKEASFHNLSLLKTVVDFKMKFYPRGWAHYEKATPGTLKLLPPAYRFDALHADFDIMSEMIFGQYPSFIQLTRSIKDLEDEINTL